MTTRQEKLSELIKKEVSYIIKKKVSDPRIGFVTLTEVKTTPDLKKALIFVSVLGSKEEQENSILGLHRATRFIRGELGEVIDLRVMPELSFKLDHSLERGSRVINIIKGIEDGFKEESKDLSRD